MNYIREIFDQQFFTIFATTHLTRANVRYAKHILSEYEIYFMGSNSSVVSSAWHASVNHRAKSHRFEIHPSSDQHFAMHSSDLFKIKIILILINYWRWSFRVWLLLLGSRVYSALFVSCRCVVWKTSFRNKFLFAWLFPFGFCMLSVFAN